MRNNDVNEIILRSLLFDNNTFIPTCNMYKEERFHFLLHHINYSIDDNSI